MQVKYIFATHIVLQAASRSEHVRVPETMLMLTYSAKSFIV